MLFGCLGRHALRLGGCNPLLVKWTYFASALAIAFAIPADETPRCRAAPARESPRHRTKGCLHHAGLKAVLEQGPLPPVPAVVGEGRAGEPAAPERGEAARPAPEEQVGVGRGEGPGVVGGPGGRGQGPEARPSGHPPLCLPEKRGARTTGIPLRQQRLAPTGLIRTDVWLHRQCHRYSCHGGNASGMKSLNR
jgi:hypothetical protein